MDFAVCYRSRSPYLWKVVMTKKLEKDYIAGAVLSEIVRQHPEIRLSSDFVNVVLAAADEICNIFARETILKDKN